MGDWWRWRHDQPDRTDPDAECGSEAGMLGKVVPLAAEKTGD